MPELHPSDQAEALWKAIQLMERHKDSVDMPDFHLATLRQMHSDAVREARK